MTYQDSIAKALERSRDRRLATVHPGVVESVLRSDYGTLDHLSAEQLAEESREIAREFVETDEKTRSDLVELAVLEGLVR